MLFEWDAEKAAANLRNHGVAFQQAVTAFPRLLTRRVLYSEMEGTSSYMTIEVHKPELEALIQQRLESGAFTDVEDVLLHALKSAPVIGTPVAHKAKKNLAQFLLESPLPGSGLKLQRQKDYPRQVDL